MCQDPHEVLYVYHSIKSTNNLLGGGYCFLIFKKKVISFIKVKNQGLVSGDRSSRITSSLRMPKCTSIFSEGNAAVSDPGALRIVGRGHRVLGLERFQSR